MSGVSISVWFIIVLGLHLSLKTYIVYCWHDTFKRKQNCYIKLFITHTHTHTHTIIIIIVIVIIVIVIIVIIIIVIIIVIIFVNNNDNKIWQ